MALAVSCALGVDEEEHLSDRFWHLGEGLAKQVQTFCVLKWIS